MGAMRMIEIPVLFFMGGSYKFLISVEDSKTKIVKQTKTFKVEAY
jgi:hypothetical protein